MGRWSKRAQITPAAAAACLCMLGGVLMADRVHADADAGPTSAAVATPDAAAQPSPAAPAAQSRPFPILEYQIEGNTLLSVREVEGAVIPHLREEGTIKDVEAARAGLEKVYHDAGYKTVIVTIPPQEVVQGVVRLHVAEAAVGQLHIAGSRYHSLSGIREKVPQLAEGSVPQFGEVQKELADVNHSADLRVTPVLKASNTPGKVDVELQVQDSLPVHATLEVDNRYSADTAHTRVTGEVQYDNLFQSNQSLSLQYQTAPSEPANAKVESVSYVVPLPDNDALAFYWVHSDSNVAAVGDLSVIGAGHIYGLRWINSLPTSQHDFFHSFTAGVDYKDLEQNTEVASGPPVESPASYTLFTLEYNGTWLGASTQGQRRAATISGLSSTTIDLSTSFTIRSLGTSGQEFADKRAGASDSFITLRPSLTREQVLPGAWTLVGRLDGQVASGPLINSEQYAAGGADSVRGYTEAERLGDNGVRASLELRTPQLFLQQFKHVDRSFLLAFVEGARLRVLEPLPGEEDLYSLASAGVGLRFKASGLTINLDGARILKDGSVTAASRYRGLFQISYTH